MAKSYPMTEQALQDLRAELKQKIEVERPALAARLKAAIELGDLSENADYTAAKEAQGFLEGRIQELQTIIGNATIIDENQSNDRVKLGNTVTVQEDGESSRETYFIVGQVEANPSQGKISNESPLGRALVGSKVGDVVRVDAPVGQLTFRILEIS